jgi:hypothetical protein
VLLLIASQYTFNWYRQEKESKEGDDNDLFTNRDAPETDAKADAEQHDDVGELRTEDSVSDDATTGHRVEQTEVQPDGLTPDEIARPYSEIEKPEPQIIKEESVEKKELESSDELKQERVKELEAQDDDVTWSEAKRSWKEENPDLTLKEFKEKYINGVIDHLPWEEHHSKKKSYIIKEGNSQIQKTTEE